MSTRARRRRSNQGFTMIEVMTVTGIVAILAAVALPNYFDYVQRSKIIEATTALADMRTRMEQWFLDNRTYVGGCDNAKLYALKNVKSFAVTCPTETADTYKIQADGITAQGMQDFVYSISTGDAKKTEKMPTGWTAAAACWSTRKDGTCG